MSNYVKVYSTEDEKITIELDMHKVRTDRKRMTLWELYIAYSIGHIANEIQRYQEIEPEDAMKGDIKYQKLEDVMKGETNEDIHCRVW